MTKTRKDLKNAYMQWCSGLERPNRPMLKIGLDNADQIDLTDAMNLVSFEASQITKSILNRYCFSFYLLSSVGLTYFTPALLKLFVARDRPAMFEFTPYRAIFFEISDCGAPPSQLGDFLKSFSSEQRQLIGITYSWYSRYSARDWVGLRRFVNSECFAKLFVE